MTNLSEAVQFFLRERFNFIYPNFCHRIHQDQTILLPLESQRFLCSPTIVPNSRQILLMNWKTCSWHLFCLIFTVQQAGHYISYKSCWPLALWTIFRIKRNILAAAHNAAKINVSQWANVRLASSRDVPGAQCVERKQPSPQDAPLPTHSCTDICFFFPPSIQGLTHAWFASRLKSMCCCFPKSAYFFFFVSCQSYSSLNVIYYSIVYILFGNNLQISNYRTR